RKTVTGTFCLRISLRKISWSGRGLSMALASLFMLHFAMQHLVKLFVVRGKTPSVTALTAPEITVD
ncbi:MAG: hypothetical protein AAF225_13975, partial [Pseudomonadota bacterium]